MHSVIVSAGFLLMVLAPCAVSFWFRQDEPRLEEHEA